jgi:hypothetical protein
MIIKKRTTILSYTLDLCVFGIISTILFASLILIKETQFNKAQAATLPTVNTNFLATLASGKKGYIFTNSSSANNTSGWTATQLGGSSTFTQTVTDGVKFFEAADKSSKDNVYLATKDQYFATATSGSGTIVSSIAAPNGDFSSGGDANKDTIYYGLGFDSARNKILYTRGNDVVGPPAQQFFVNEAGSISNVNPGYNLLEFNGSGSTFGASINGVTEAVSLFGGVGTPAPIGTAQQMTSTCGGELDRFRNEINVAGTFIRYRAGIFAGCGAATGAVNLYSGVIKEIIWINSPSTINEKNAMATRYYMNEGVSPKTTELLNSTYQVIGLKDVNFSLNNDFILIDSGLSTVSRTARNNSGIIVNYPGLVNGSGIYFGSNNGIGVTPVTGSNVISARTNKILQLQKPIGDAVNETGNVSVTLPGNWISAGSSEVKAVYSSDASFSSYSTVNTTGTGSYNFNIPVSDLNSSAKIYVALAISNAPPTILSDATPNPISFNTAASIISEFVVPQTVISTMGFGDNDIPGGIATLGTDVFLSSVSIANSTPAGATGTFTYYDSTNAVIPNTTEGNATYFSYKPTGNSANSITFNLFVRDIYGAVNLIPKTVTLVFSAGSIPAEVRMSASCYKGDVDYIKEHLSETSSAQANTPTLNLRTCIQNTTPANSLVSTNEVVTVRIVLNNGTNYNYTGLLGFQNATTKGVGSSIQNNDLLGKVLSSNGSGSVITYSGYKEPGETVFKPVVVANSPATILDPGAMSSAYKTYTVPLESKKGAVEYLFEFELGSIPQDYVFRPALQYSPTPGNTRFLGDGNANGGGGTSAITNSQIEFSSTQSQFTKTFTNCTVNDSLPRPSTSPFTIVNNCNSLSLPATTLKGGDKIVISDQLFSNSNSIVSPVKITLINPDGLLLQTTQSSAERTVENGNSVYDQVATDETCTSVISAVCKNFFSQYIIPTSTSIKNYNLITRTIYTNSGVGTFYYKQLTTLTVQPGQANNTLDTDNDGVPDVIEDGGNFNGDINRDGIADRFQNTIASGYVKKLDGTDNLLVPFSIQIQPNGAAANCLGGFTSVNAILPSTQTTSITDADYNYPYGMIKFIASNCKEAKITLTIFNDTDKKQYVIRKLYQRTPGNNTTLKFKTLTEAVVSKVTVLDYGATQISYIIKDGEVGDLSNIDDKLIDPVGLAELILNASSSSSNTSNNSTTGNSNASSGELIRTGIGPSLFYLQIVLLSSLFIVGIKIAIHTPSFRHIN